MHGLGQDEPKKFIAWKAPLMATPAVMTEEQRASIAAKQQAAAEQAALEAALMQQMLMAAQQEQEQTGLPTWAWALIGVGGAGVILAAMYFLVFRKKGSEVDEPEVRSEALPPTAADTLMQSAAGIRGDDDWGKYLRR